MIDSLPSYMKDPTALATLEIIATVSAAFFGILGLLNDYKDEEGKVTWTGRIAIGGIVLAALLSFFTREIEGELDALKKSEEEQKDLDRQELLLNGFESVLSDLETVSSDVTTLKKDSDSLRGAMRTSVALQTESGIELQTAAEKIAQISNQQLTDSQSLLDFIWKQSNRADLNNIQARLDFYCALNDPSNKYQADPFFGENVAGKLRLFEDGSNSANFKAELVSSESIIRSSQTSIGNLRAIRQYYDFEFRPDSGSSYIEYYRGEKWANGHIEIELDSPNERNFSDLYPFIQPTSVIGNKWSLIYPGIPPQLLYTREQIEASRRIPCATYLFVSVGGRGVYSRRVLAYEQLDKSTGSGIVRIRSGPASVIEEAFDASRSRVGEFKNTRK